MFAFLLAIATQHQAVIWENPSAKPTSINYFGMHLETYKGDMSPAGARVNFGTYRIWWRDNRWFDMEPTAPKDGKHTYYFDKCDKLVEEGKGRQIIYCFGFTPRWAAKNPDAKPTWAPGSGSRPKDLNDYRLFTEAVVKRYKGKIQFYEAWNEPNGDESWDGTVEDMVQVTKILQETVRKHDPKAKVIGPSPFMFPYYEKLMAAGVSKYCDILAYHIYEEYTPEEKAAIIAKLRKFEPTKPLWITETNWLFVGWSFSKPELRLECPKRLEAAYVARYYLLGELAGADRLIWWIWDDYHKLAALKLTEADLQTPTKGGLAYSEVQKWMIGKRVVKATLGKDGVCEVELLDKAQKRERVVWHREVQSWDGEKRVFDYKQSTYTLPTTAKVIRYLDGTSRETKGQVVINEEPVIFAY
jgi:hypothetical protein